MTNRVPRAVVVMRAQPRDLDRPAPLAVGRAVLVAVQGPKGRAVASAVTSHLGARHPQSRVHVVDIVTTGDIARATAPDALDVSKTGALIDLRALDAPGEVEGALRSAKASLFLAQHLRPFLLESARSGGAHYLVATTLDGDAHVLTGAVHGLLKTAALEWPEVACTAVDVHPDLDVASAIIKELASGFWDVEVAHTTEGRMVPVVESAPTAPADLATFADTVWVASGGARGVTATTLLALARATRPALLLLGRTPIAPEPAHCRTARDEASLKRALIDARKGHGQPVQLAAVGEEAKRILAVREIAQFLTTLEEAGARVLYRAVDVRDAGAVAVACQEARAAFGPITGLVHGAGVLADKRIEDKTSEQVDHVMDTKVLGLHALLQALRDDPLRHVVLFSSVAGRYGNVGQVDYAMANEALNHMAQQLRRDRPSCTVKALNWGPWEGGMVTPALKKVFEERGVRVLSHADGARHFIDELSANAADVEVVFGGELSAPQAEAQPHVETPRSRFNLTGPAWSFLADHAVRGVPVLPVVGAIELFARTTHARVFKDVRVLRGVKLPQLGTQDASVSTQIEVERNEAAVSLWVAGDRHASYTAEVVAPTEPLSLRGPEHLEAWRRPDPYAGLLFHGPRFHMIDAVEGAGRSGLVARVRGCLGRGWGDDFSSDMGALDAGLQAALLWARHNTDGAFLPTAIGRVCITEPVAGALRCILVGHHLDDARGVCDVALVDMAGRTVASLEKVELHRLGDDDAFAGVAHDMTSVTAGARSVA